MRLGFSRMGGESVEPAEVGASASAGFGRSGWRRRWRWEGLPTLRVQSELRRAAPGPAGWEMITKRIVKKSQNTTKNKNTLCILIDSLLARVNAYRIIRTNCKHAIKKHPERNDH